jgi:hypothetical protein
MLLITTFVELCVVSGRSWTRAGHRHAISGRPMLIHTCHAMPMPRCAVALRSCHQNGMVMAWHGHGMACVNQTRLHCVNKMGKTQSKPLTARHGRGTAWEWHGVCELALSKPIWAFFICGSANFCWAWNNTNMTLIFRQCFLKKRILSNIHISADVKITNYTYDIVAPSGDQCPIIRTSKFTSLYCICGPF